MAEKRWWLIGTAAVLAGLFLVDSLGFAAVAGVGVAAAAGIAAYRFHRARNPAKGPTVECLRCGATLALTARECQHCGSASWTMRQ